MGATTRDIFGTDGGSPATAGTYGERPKGYRLPDALTLGEVRLRVADLDRSVEYYTTVLGLRVVERDAARARLAPQGADHVLVELNAVAGLKPAHKRGRLGLYHFAILLPDRPSLGRFVRHIAELGVYAGAGDHLVSEAFYLTDPDGLGIEVYADRPRDTWRQVQQQLRMATDPVDINGVVAAAGETRWTGMPAGTVMGHLHLHVGTIEGAAAFYSEALGFDRIVWSYPGALFMSAGGYHHHLGTNTWAGRDAVGTRADEAGLIEWTIQLPTSADVDAAAASVASAGFTVAREHGDAVLADPWGTKVRVRAAR